MNRGFVPRFAGSLAALFVLSCLSTASAQFFSITGRSWGGGPYSRFGWTTPNFAPVGSCVSYGGPGFSSFTWGTGAFTAGVGYPGWFPPAYCGPSFGYPWVLPPLVIPAESVYGPAAAWRMLDPIMSPASAVPAPININIIRAPGPGPGPDLGNALTRKPEVKVRSSNDSVRDRARRYLDAGDKYFRNQKYRDAYMRYRQASETAPDLMEGFFRQSQALFAMGRYENAARQLKRGINVNPQWLKRSTNLDTLYGPNRIAKAAHIEALAIRAAEQPDDADLWFLVGAELYFDGQQQRSRKFFERAKQLTTDSNEHLTAFLTHIPRVVPVAARDSAQSAGADL